ncbi:MAG TPA: amidohydrolase family protein [Vicinamibacterales bacterium]|nr:amidohydrolase family protein [Vicinamibacterales bacterium]
MGGMVPYFADTALFGARPAVECGFEFFGADRVLFASDMPFDPEKGPMFIRETIRNLSEMALSDADRQKVFAGNAPDHAAEGHLAVTLTSHGRPRVACSSLRNPAPLRSLRLTLLRGPCFLCARPT